MKRLFGLLFGLSIAMVLVLSTDLDDWNAYKSKYKKNYQNETEDSKRREIFLQNKHKIEEHNGKHSQGLVSFKMGVNKFSDLTHEEFNAQMKGLRSPDLLASAYAESETVEENARRKHHRHHHHNHHHRLHHHHNNRHHHHRYHHHHRHHHPNDTIYEYLPKSIDWTKEGAVNGVKNKTQGACGSCWAFATTGAIEGQHFRKTGKLVDLSEQNLVDCADDILGPCGCMGCSLDGAYLYAQTNGIDTANEYPKPYSETNGDCEFNSSNAIKIKDFRAIPAGDEYKLREAIATIGPISVEMDASHVSFHLYHSGIYHEPECNSNNLDHGVLAVGYGTDEKGNDYYIVKNWWGEDWGERGYFRIARNHKNHCGIATVAKYPIV